MLLLIPGPVTTRPAVRQALNQDFAPWDHDFRSFASKIRRRVLHLAGAADATHAALPLQGCGHFITEATLRTFIPPNGQILIPVTGAYAERMIRLAREAGRQPIPLPIPPTEMTDPALVAAALKANSSVTHVGMVYSETGTGIVHDIAAIGSVVRSAGRRMIVDAVSAFGALPLDMAAQPEIDATVFTTNKCLEALPGLGFAVTRTDSLSNCKGNAGSWSFDLHDIYDITLRSGPGTFRFTPPAQIMAALDVALDFLDTEGMAARLARYTRNRDVLYQGVQALGLTPWLPARCQGPIIVNVLAPDDPAWNLQAFVDKLKLRGFLISNFYNTPSPTFRVGCIGAIGPEDMAAAVEAMDQALTEMGVTRREGARQ